ncbi:MAG: cysteine/glutathione ABC transporter permease/ATP-binding protein CydD [Aeromonadaceae bacterium]
MDKLRQQTLVTWLRQQRRLAKPWLTLCVLYGGLSAGLLIAQAWLLAELLHGFIIHGLQKSTQLPLLLLLLGLTVARSLLAMARERAAFTGATRVRRQIRARILGEMERRGPAYLQRQPAGSWASLLHEQVEDLHDFYARYLPQTQLSVLQPLLILLAIFPVNWAAGTILLVTAPLIPLFMILTGIGAADANRRNFEALRRLSGHFLDRLRGMATLRLYRRSQAEQQNIARASEEFRERTMEVLRMAFLSSAVLEFFASVAIAILAVYFGFSYLEHLDFGNYGSKVTLFTGLFALLLAPDFYLPLRELGAHYHAKAQAIGAADAIESFLNQSLLPLPGGEQRLADHEPLTIEASELEVLSPEGVSLVGPLSFTLAAGQKTLLIGQTGSGKSSLLAALLGFLPYRGSLKVQGIELSTLAMPQWRQQIAWLGQNPKLIHGSLRDNLTLGRPASEQQLLDAMTQARALDILQEKGWDYLIGDGAAGLSVGQAQRLALARALLFPSRLLLLDEPTASLDSDNEQQILAALPPLLQGRTSLMVSHRLDQIDEADQLLLLGQGQLLAAGTPAKLRHPGSPLHALLAQTAAAPGATREGAHHA